jgi:cytidine deaminase
MVKIVQTLCRNRHCIIAATADGPTDESMTVFMQYTIARFVEEKAMNPHCGLCGSPINEWSYEVGETRFETMEEARPALFKMEQQNLETRALFHASGQAFDSPKVN